MILETVFPIFLIIIIGFLIGKLKKIDLKPLTQLIIYLAAPCLIFSSVSKSDVSLPDFLLVALSMGLVIVISGFILFLIFKTTKSNKLGLYLPMTIGNTGYLGYPIALFAFGAAGLSQAVIADITSSFFLYSAGIFIIHHENDWKEIFKVPLIYAVVGGIIYNLLKIPLPLTISRPIEMIGAITIPLALLILGYRLTEIKITSVKTTLLASAFKIAGCLSIAVIIVKLLSITGLSRNIILLQAAMPSAVMSMILTEKYQRDSELVASIILVSTLLSLITIPLVLW